MAPSSACRRRHWPLTTPWCSLYTVFTRSLASAQSSGATWGNTWRAPHSPARSINHGGRADALTVEDLADRGGGARRRDRRDHGDGAAAAAPPARNRRRRASRRRRSRAPRSRSPSAPSRPASTRTSSTTAASGRSTTTSTRPCSPARLTASWHPVWRPTLPTQVDDTTWEFTLREGVTFHNGEPFNADSVVATINRMVGLVERGETDNDGFYATLVGAEAVDEYTVRIMTDGPDGVLPARMYWLKQIPASAEETPDLSDEPIGTGPYRFESRNQGVDIVLVANEEYWGEARHDRPSHLRVLRRRGDPPRRPEVGALRPDHQPRSPGRRAGPGLRVPPGPGAPDPDPRRRRGHHRRRQRPAAPSTSPSTRTPSPRTRSAGTPRSMPASCCRRRSSATTTHSSRSRTTPRRPSACSRRPASAARRSSSSASPGAGSRTASCSRRSPATGPPSDSTCSSRSSSSAPTSTSSSTGRTGPTRSTCRAPTTCSIPTASCRRTTRRAASARRTATRRWPR